MGIRHLFLIITLFSLLVLEGMGEAAAPPVPGCTSCHPAHHAGYASCIDCHRGNPATRRKGLAHVMLIAGRYASFRFPGSPRLRQGENLAGQLACRRCHIISGKGERRAANLDRLFTGSPPEQIDAAISRPAFAMPDFRLDSEQRAAIITFLLAGGALHPPAVATGPVVVHFTPLSSKRNDPFTTHCGGCHKLLTSNGEVLGKGETGPNLSALLTPNYPQSFPPGQRWTAELLLRWLTNPRAVRANAMMQPRRLSSRDYHSLLILLDGPGGALTTHRLLPRSGALEMTPTPVSHKQK